MTTNYTFKEFNNILSTPKEPSCHKVARTNAILIPLTMACHNVYAINIKQSALEVTKSVIIGICKWMFDGLVEYSHPICLTIGIVALIFYLCGFKQSGKYVTVSFVIYTLLQAMKSVM